MTPADLLRIADLLRCPPSAADIDERWDYVIALHEEANDTAQPKETRP